MTSRRASRHLTTTLAALSLATAAPLLSACGGEESDDQPARTSYTPPPPPPLAPLEELPMDPRVQFPQSREPSTRALAEGIADLASAIVSGDDEALQAVLDEDGKRVLRQLTSQGLWSESTADIEAVRVCSLSEPTDGACELGLGIQDPRGAYLLAWSGRREGESWIFSPKPVDAVEAPQLAMLDDAPIVPPALPSPEQYVPEEEEEVRTPIERFSK